MLVNSHSICSLRERIRFVITFAPAVGDGVLDVPDLLHATIATAVTVFSTVSFLAIPLEKQPPSFYLFFSFSPDRNLAYTLFPPE